MVRRTSPRLTLLRSPAAGRGWRAVAAVAITLTLGLTAACSGDSGGVWQPPGGAGGTSAATRSAALTFSLAADAVNVSPADIISVEVADGTLETVALTNPEGATVKGDFDADRKVWKSGEELGYNKAYKLAVSSRGTDGKTVEETRSFTTVKPVNQTLPYLRADVSTLLDGGTFGVGQPIMIWFDEPITDQASAERSLTVTTDPPVVGAWRWLNNREVVWRPEAYWPPSTKVTVDAKVYGKDLGGGLFGQEDRKASFTIGRSKIAIADSNTKRMTVYLDGAQVTTINGNDVTGGIPISLGKNGGETAPNGSWIDFRTSSGPHVVTTKSDVVRMTSASYGLTDPNSPNFYDELIKKAVRISGDGEYVHLADWNIWAHGNTNTSHGCVNVAPAYIYWFYDTFGTGDIVEVQNTGKALSLGYGGYWTMPFAEWAEGSAL